ncbi:MAG TPA: L,D-transpeptidase family protein [Stellaceae bacterium]|nr:L,D-transpeptidase family protein [Stellaceae bacterium]
MTNRCTTPQSTEVVRRWAPPAIVTLAATAALTALTAAPPADAAPRQARPEHTTEGAAPRAAGEPIMAIVSIKSQKVTIYDADGWVLRAPVSSGTAGRETPAGVFSVVEKDKDHRSSLYDDAWMPHMLRITWNGLALHGGPLPGYAASHGCVRMPFGFAEKLFDKVPIGTRVVISPSDAEPVEFSHPALFVPKSAAVAAAPSRAETLAREADEASKLAQQTKNAAALAVKEAAPLTAALRKLELALAAAKTDQAKARAEDQKQKAAAKVEELQTQLDAAKANAKSKLDAAAAAQDAAKAAETKKADVAKAASEANLALEPVSIFISRKAQKLYVRRGFEPILESPVTIRDPDQPIGTHVFTAVSRSDTALRWTVVSLNEPSDAKSALDRIVIPPEVLDRIAPTALPRSSLIISDEPLHRETNYRTEFVIALNDQPQGGIINRPRSPDIRVARRDDFGFGWGGWGFNNTPGRNYYQRPQRWW